MKRCLLLIPLVLAACGSEIIVHDVDEKQANAIIVLLDDNQIRATKLQVVNGRVTNYSVAVSASASMGALKVLQLNEYPQKKVNDYAEVYKEAGLIPTASQEKANKLRSIEGEIEKQLRLINDVLDAEVNIVMPDETALRTTEDAQSPTTASVAIKYMPGRGGSKPVSEPYVQAMVAASVEKLTPDKVVVVMTPATKTSAADSEKCADGTIPGAQKTWIQRLTPKAQNMLSAGVLIAMLILCLGLVFGQVRLRNVRGRLIKLQNEIARARRKSETPAPVQQS
jgi:type III secretion protein J